MKEAEKPAHKRVFLLYSIRVWSKLILTTSGFAYIYKSPRLWKCMAGKPVTLPSVSLEIIHPLELLPEFLPDLGAVTVKDAEVFCSFEDGRTLSFPLQGSDKLNKVTVAQRQAFELNAHFIFWDELDEIIGVRNTLLGNKLYW